MNECINSPTSLSTFSLPCNLNNLGVTYSEYHFFWSNYLDWTVASATFRPKEWVPALAAKSAGPFPIRREMVVDVTVWSKELL
jgi:hypothetical protein